MVDAIAEVNQILCLYPLLVAYEGTFASDSFHGLLACGAVTAEEQILDTMAPGPSRAPRRAGPPNAINSEERSGTFSLHEVGVALIVARRAIH